MYINTYEYLIPTNDCGDHIEIDGINRKDNTAMQFINKVNEIVLTVPTAVLYAGGTVIGQADSRDVSNVNPRYMGTVSNYPSSTVIKDTTVYNLHKWIGSMKNNELVTYANINGNTCASSMFSLYEAERLLNLGTCEEVIIIAEERTSFNTIRIFKEHSIPITCGDGFAMVRLSKAPIGFKVSNTKWEYSYNKNPFGTTIEGYNNVDTSVHIDNVKPHDTGTTNNTEAEAVIIKNRNVISYKKDIGHTQGVSALLEICMLLADNNIKGTALCVASGLGGFYGSCIVHK